MTNVTMTTSKGVIKLELDDAKAPETVKNFVAYAEAGHYNGTIFHRVIDGFMIQGGGMTPDMEQKPTRDSIQNEAGNGLKNDRGTVAMARTQAPHSATSQFFINVVDNDFLNYRSADAQGFGYCVFGKVADKESLDVVDKIRGVKTGRRSFFQDVPNEDVVIEKVEITA
jgi:peptidyl-prolyl cis-trans isomerase B (cyclophilin B)